MLDRRIGLLLVGGLTITGYAIHRVWTPTQVEFTRAAPPALTAVELRPELSTAHVTLPLDLARVARRTEQALAQRLAMGLDVADPACARRASAPDCAGVKLDGAVTLAGSVETSASPGVVRLRLPLKVDVAVQGTERTRIDAPLTFVFRVQGSHAAAFEVARLDEAVTDPASGPHARILRLVETRLKPIALSAQDELRAVLADLPVAAATQRAWSALSNSIEIGADTWLKGQPEVAGAGEIAAADGRPVVRVPIATRISVETGVRSPAPPRRSVVHGQVNTAGAAVIRMAMPISLTALQPAIDQAFVKAGVIETRPDRFGPSVKVEVARAKLYPSVRQLAVELDISATRYEGQVYYGKAHLVGRPVLDGQQRLVTLADIGFPSAAQRETGNVKSDPGAPRLATDPFAAKLANAVRIDVSRDVDEALPRTNRMLHQRIDDRLSLSARLEQVKPASFEVASSGGWLLIDLAGSLTLNMDAQEVVVGSDVAAGQRTVDAAGSAGNAPRRIATPELAAAAVVSVTTLQAAKAAAAGGLAHAAAAQVEPSASAQAISDAPKPSVAKRALIARPATGRPVAQKEASAPQAVGKGSWVPFPTNN